jgi:adenosylcobinamide-GDP ribazoletransferase
MKKQLHIFFAALMFLTRIPVPKWVQHTEAYLQRATKYFTLIGIIVGVIGATTYYVSSLFLSNTIAIILSIIATVLTTGSFHEDGFADVCDAFGGGYTKEKILEIMKDSRLGTYGTIGLILIVLLKFFLLLELSTTSLSPNVVAISLPFQLKFPLLMIVAHSVSRFMPLVIIQNYEYVFQHDVSKSKPLASQKLSFGELLFAFIISVLLFIFLPIQFLAAYVFMIAITFYLGNYFKKWIGGYTGDCLGTVQQVGELVFLLSVLIINKILFF